MALVKHIVMACIRCKSSGKSSGLNRSLYFLEPDVPNGVRTSILCWHKIDHCRSGAQ